MLNWRRRRADLAFRSNDLITARKVYEQCLHSYEKSSVSNPVGIKHCLERLVEIHNHTEGIMSAKLTDFHLQSLKQRLKLYEPTLVDIPWTMLEGVAPFGSCNAIVFRILIGAVLQVSGQRRENILQRTCHHLVLASFVVKVDYLSDCAIHCGSHIYAEIVTSTI